MLKILKAEYSYLIYGSAHTILLLLAMVVFYKIIDVIILNRITFMIGILLMAHLIGQAKKENRNRLLISLPIKNRTIAIARIAMLVLPLLILYAVAISINLLSFGYSTEWNDSIFELLSIGLITILFALIYFFLSDIFSLFETKRGKIIYEVIISIIILAAALFTIITTKNSFTFSLSSGISINIILFAAIIFFVFVTITTFKQKESHIL